MVRHPMVHLDYLDIFHSFGRGLSSSCANIVQTVFMPVTLEPWDHAMSTRFYLERNWCLMYLIDMPWLIYQRTETPSLKPCTGWLCLWKIILQKDLTC